MELQGLKTVEGEEPPRVMHFNPRLKGDWSGKPVIELNTCYRMHWGTALRCDGWKSRAGEDTGKKNYVYIHYGCDVWSKFDTDTFWILQLFVKYPSLKKVMEIQYEYNIEP